MGQSTLTGRAYLKLDALRHSSGAIPVRGAIAACLLWANIGATTLVAQPLVGGVEALLPGDCSGIDVTLANRHFAAVDATCIGTQSLSAGPSVTVSDSSDVSFIAPVVSLGPGFSVEIGSFFNAVTITAPPDISINSTSQNSSEVGPDPAALGPVAEQAMASEPGYRLMAINDLGMHCGDLDTRIASILPPFSVMHAQVLRTGPIPSLLDDARGIEVLYSAASNAADPVLDPTHPNYIPVRAADGSVFKTNFWDIALEAYGPFYPTGVLDLFYPVGLVSHDLGLPVPDVEQFFLGPDGLAGTGDEAPLELDQQAMPSMTVLDTSDNALPLHQPINLLSDPYIANQPQTFAQYVETLPFFVGDFDAVPGQDFPFGYTTAVNWFAADGIPIAAFDDFGRENPYPLMRVQAKALAGNDLGEPAEQVLASLDTVVPISAEADCLACHADPGDGGNGEATQTLFDEGVDVATADEDPHKGGVPLAVSIEYASDINILRLHDLKHGSEYPAGDDGNACDFLNVPSDPDCLVNRTPVVCQLCHYTPALDLAQVGPRDENGREQIDNKTMSNVMHSHHGALTDLFPAMPPPTDPARTSGPPVNDFESDILGRTCYRCHPGERTAGLRGAMFNAGILCQDCHGDMEQVGNDFSRSVPGGDFELSADYYTNPDTPRVPWANEPGCGSCHTGDAVDNLAGDTDKIAASTLNTGDTIRLIQAYRVGDTKATPIVPTNKRFAEDVVESGPAANNPKLYRLSSGGISLAPAHGKSGHGDLFCEVCHGTDGLGTVLSRTAASRYLECKEVQSGATDPGNGCSSVPGVGKRILVSKGEQIGCDLCHDNKINE